MSLEPGNIFALTDNPNSYDGSGKEAQAHQWFGDLTANTGIARITLGPNKSYAQGFGFLFFPLATNSNILYLSSASPTGYDWMMIDPRKRGINLSTSWRVQPELDYAATGNASGQGVVVYRVGKVKGDVATGGGTVTWISPTSAGLSNNWHNAGIVFDFNATNVAITAQTFFTADVPLEDEKIFIEFGIVVFTLSAVFDRYSSQNIDLKATATGGTAMEMPHGFYKAYLNKQI
jgi:hypothetical protein